MNYKLCIMCAGIGSRVNVYDNLHKSLLPLGNRATISRIIDCFSKDIEIVVALGYLSEQVKTFLEYVHFDRKLQFVYVDNYNKPGSGPGYSLLRCKDFLQCPFVFTSADTVVNKNEHILDPSCNWIGVGKVKNNKEENFLLYSTEIGLYYGKGDDAFIGMSGVLNYNDFWNGLNEVHLEKGEHQVLNGLKKLNNISIKYFSSWLDTGTIENYQTSIKKYDKIVEEKKNEIIYIENNKVVKFFSDKNIIEKRIKRSKVLHDMVPEVCSINENMYGYNFIEGTLLSRCYDESIFNVFFDTLSKHYIKKDLLNNESFYLNCLKMHKEKTIIRSCADKIKYLDLIDIINGYKVRKISDILNDIDWNEIINDSIPIKFHGDLQPENIIYNGEKFIFIDWRDSFGDSTEIGDLYYDLGKLYHASIVNGDVIRNDNFFVEIDDNTATVDILVKNNLLSFMMYFRRFCVKNKYNWNRVVLLGILQFINISSLHSKKYSEFLFLFGKIMLEKHLKGENYGTFN